MKKTLAELRAETDQLMHRPLHMDHEARIAALAAERNAADFEIARLTRERDEAQASLERLRDAAFTECEVVKCGWSHDERHCSLHGVWFKSGEDAAECPVGQHARKVLAAGGHDWPEALEAAAAALAGEGEAPSCAWTMDDEGVWHTGCGASWIYFTEGTPDEHGQRFCHACGKSIAAAAGLDDEGRPSP